MQTEKGMAGSAWYARPRAAVVALAFVSAWTAAPRTGPREPQTQSRRTVVGCLLMADPGVHRSYIPPPPRASLSTIAGPQSKATVSVVYHGFTPEAQAAFQFAVDIWAAQLDSSQTITIEAEFSDLGPDWLGFTGPGSIWVGVPGGLADTFYPAAITNRLLGRDQDGGVPDIFASFTSSVNWYYGTDGTTPFHQYDFVSVVLHELAHGLAFFGSARVPGIGDGQWGFNEGGIPYPTIYDRFVVNGAGQSILNTALFPNPSAALTAQLTGNALFFSGPHARAANGNANVRLYAPSSWDTRWSYSHLNESTYASGTPNSLMTPFVARGEAIHDPGPVTRGMMRDMGWVVNGPTCSYSASATQTSFNGSGGIGTVTITTSTDCPWTVGSGGAGWITFTSPTSGTGSATVNFSVAPNPSRFPRQGTITAAGHALAISQAGMPCTFSASPNLVTFGAGGGTALVHVTASASDCPFGVSAAPEGSWAIVTGNQVGSSSLTLTVGPSGATTRTTTLSIGGFHVGVRQNGHATPTFDTSGDGAADLVAYDPATGARFFAFGRPQNLGFDLGGSAPWSPGWSVSPGDFNGDGRGDLFFYNPSTGRAIKARATGAETFGYTEFAWPSGGEITIADFNGDGSDDVLLYDRTSGVARRCTSHPDGSFSFCSGPYLWSPNWSIYPGDFNGDGRADLFVYNATGDANHGRWFRILTEPPGPGGLGDPPGGGHVVTYIDGDVVWRNDWTITPGDYDGDGRTDLFLYRPGGEWYRVFFTPSGTRYERGVWSPGWTLSRGDFNGDGRTDLFVYNESTGRWYVVISKADGSLGYFGDQVWAAGWKVSVTDVNVDGVSDLVLYNPTDGRWFQAVTRSPGVFDFASGTWATSMQIHATRPQPR